MSNQLGAQHRFSVLAHFVGAASELDPASLAAAAGMYLGLHDPQIAAQLFRRCDRGVGGLGGDATRHRYAVIGKQSFRLVFVQIHWIVGVVVLTGRRIL